MTDERIKIMQPIILGIETSTDACSVAISANERISAVFVLEPQAHSKLLLDMVTEVCTQAGVKLSQVEAIAFGQGPGSFTGVRIAASVVQGLAFGLKKPAVAISSLRAIAQQAHNKLQANKVLALIDARMQEIYCGEYVFDRQGIASAVSEDCLIKPVDLTIDMAEDWLAVGTACPVYAPVLRELNPLLEINTTILYPHAAEIVQLALVEYAAGNTLTADAVVPAYIRNDVAQTSKKNTD